MRAAPSNSAGAVKLSSPPHRRRALRPRWTWCFAQGTSADTRQTHPGSVASPAGRGKKCPATCRRTPIVCPGGSSAPGSVSSAGSGTPNSLALAMSAGATPNVRAAASRWVNASPSPQALRSVAISEVWRYSSLYTDPGSTHGDTMMAGTRYPERSKVKPNPSMFGSLSEKSGSVPAAASSSNCERHEVGGQPVSQPGEVDHPGERDRHRLHDVDLRGPAVGLQPLKDRLGVVACEPLLH